MAATLIHAADNLLKPSILLNTAPAFTSSPRTKPTRSSQSCLKTWPRPSDNLDSRIATRPPSDLGSLLAYYPFEDDACGLPDSAPHTRLLPTNTRTPAHLNPRRALHRTSRFHNEAEMQAQLDEVRRARGAFDPSHSEDDEQFFFSSDSEHSECGSLDDLDGFNDLAVVEKGDEDSFFEESSFARHIGGVKYESVEVGLFGLATSNSFEDIRTLIPSLKSNVVETSQDEDDFSFSTCSGGASFSLMEESFEFW